MPAETVSWFWEKGFYGPEEMGKLLGVRFQAAGLTMAELELAKESIWWG